MRRRDVIALLLSGPGLVQAQGIHEPYCLEVRRSPDGTIYFQFFTHERPTDSAMTKVAARAFAIYRKQDRVPIWEVYSKTGSTVDTIRFGVVPDGFQAEARYLPIPALAPKVKYVAIAKVPTSMTMRTFDVDDLISQPLRCEVDD